MNINRKYKNIFYILSYLIKIAQGIGQILNKRWCSFYGSVFDKMRILKLVSASSIKFNIFVLIGQLSQTNPEESMRVNKLFVDFVVSRLWNGIPFSQIISEAYAQHNWELTHEDLLRICYYLLREAQIQTAEKVPLLLDAFNALNDISPVRLFNVFQELSPKDILEVVKKPNLPNIPLPQINSHELFEFISNNAFEIAVAVILAAGVVGGIYWFFIKKSTVVIATSSSEPVVLGTETTYHSVYENMYYINVLTGIRIIFLVIILVFIVFLMKKYLAERNLITKIKYGFYTYILFIRSFFLSDKVLKVVPIFQLTLNFIVFELNGYYPNHFNMFTTVYLQMVIGCFLISYDMMGSIISANVLNQSDSQFLALLLTGKQSRNVLIRTISTQAILALVVGKTPMTVAGRITLIGGAMSGTCWLTNEAFKRGHKASEAEKTREHEAREAEKTREHEAREAQRVRDEAAQERQHALDILRRKQAYDLYLHEQKKYESKPWYKPKGNPPVWNDETGRTEYPDPFKQKPTHTASKPKDIDNQDENNTKNTATRK